MSAETGPQWDRYAAALPSIAAAVGRTPLVRLNRLTRDVKPAIYVKVEWFGPSGSLKDRIYFHMFEQAEARITAGERPAIRFRVPADLLLPPPKKAPARRATKRAAG